MSKRWKAGISKRSYLGVSAGGPHPGVQADHRGLYDLRPHRFAPLDGASAEDILTELVNLPKDEKSKTVEGFIRRVHNLALGLTSSSGKPAPRMSAKEVIGLSGLYQRFWESGDAIKSSLFMTLIGPRPDAYQNLNQADLFPMKDFGDSALQMEWKTGRFKIIARGPVDYLTHAVFQNRNRLRKCAGEGCIKLFIAARPHEKHCSTTCKREAELKRKRQWFRENLAKTTKGERN